MMMMKGKFIFSVIFLSLLNFAAFGETLQEAETPSPVETPAPAPSFFSACDLTAEFSPAIYINPESSLVSAPSPVIYPVSIGFLWPNYTKIAIQPTLSFFTMYHLWYDGQALPAEIENRTSQTINLLLDIPAVFSIYSSEKSRFQFSSGLAFLMRFGILAGGVKETDSGYTGSAGSDMDKINSYFWDNARFLYMSFGASWLYDLVPHLRLGPVFHTYLPLGTMFAGEGVQGMIISLGLKLNFHL